MTNPNIWMSLLQDKRLYEVIIPGTHDSGTEGFPAGSPSRTQYYKIDEQLAGGVRFLDMRLAYNSAEDNFHVVHAGDVLSYLNFDTVVKWCNDFLQNNPTETILMSIKQEGTRPGSDAAFADELSSWHDAHASKGDWKQDLWYTDHSAVPTISQAKSKIVLLRRYHAALRTSPLFFGGFNLTYINGNQAGDWSLVTPDAPTPTNPSVVGSVQDKYELGPEDKKGPIDGMLTQMGSNVLPSPPNTRGWSINFASTSSPGPLRAADVINPWLKVRLGEIPGKLYGILITDYAQPELWQQIYEINFR